MKLSKALELFIEYENVIGSSQNTIRYYRQTLGYFIEFTGDIEINKVTTNVYNKYVIYLRNKKVVVHNKETKRLLSDDTIRNRTIAVKAFFNYLYNNKYIRSNIFEGVKIFKCGKKVITVLNKKQIMEIINYYDENTFLGARNLLIISLFLDCGLRLSEVVNLKIQDILVELNCINVLGKGNKERLVPLSDTTLEYFYNYRKFYTIKKGKLLVDEKNRPITNCCISKIFRVLRANLGFEKLHPHFLRHTFATLFLINGGDALSLQLILGHTTLTMTEHYVHIANQLMIARQKQYSPLSNI